MFSPPIVLGQSDKDLFNSIFKIPSMKPYRKKVLNIDKVLKNENELGVDTYIDNAKTELMKLGLNEGLNKMLSALIGELYQFFQNVELGDSLQTSK